MKAFYVLLTDHDKKEFNFVGPVSDDTFWTNRTSELQSQGREVNCDLTASTFNVEAEKRAYAATHGYTFNRSLRF